MSDPVLIRQYAPSDEGYVYSTWLRDLRDADNSGLPDDLWFPAHRELITRLLASEDHTVLIACAADDTREILGYVVSTNEALEWVSVRKGLRRNGIARKLLEAAGVTREMPSRWSTPLGRKHLGNPCRSRQLRNPAPK